MKFSYLSLSLPLFVSGGLARSVPNSYPGSDPAVENRTLDEIYAAAQKEGGELVVFSGGDALSQGLPIVAAWEKRFPKVKLNLTVDLSKYHDSRVDRSYQTTGSDGADVAVLQTLHDFDRWKQQGRLLPYKPAVWDTIYPDVRDPSGAFTGAFFYQFGDIVYDSNLLNDTDVPTTYDKFIEPEWKDKLILTYPNDDDAITYLFSLIINKYGWSWFESLAQQNVQWVRGTGTPYALLNDANSTRSVSFTTNIVNSTHLSTKAATDPHLYWPQTAAIFATTTRPESARLFVSWLLSDEYQQQQAEEGSPVVRSGINGTTAHWWDRQSNVATEFHQFELDRKNAEWWRLQFETTLGTAQGGSPLTYGI